MVNNSIVYIYANIVYISYLAIITHTFFAQKMCIASNTHFISYFKVTVFENHRNLCNVLDLCTVSCHSFSGSESAVSPPPTYIQYLSLSNSNERRFT